MITQNETDRLFREAEKRRQLELRVLVVGGGFQYIKMFYDAGMKGATTVDDADIVCFTGGEDVDPSFYGEKPIEGVYANIARDTKECAIYGDALIRMKPMVGICRGAQFLCAMNNGKLWQDVNNHAIRGGHGVLDLRTNKLHHNMTSTHHQQMRPGKEGQVIAVAELSTYKTAEKETVKRDEPEADDVEVVWHPDSRALCFQPHPEFGHGECRNYFLSLLDDYVIPAC